MNLATQYLGLPLKNPLVVAASPFSRDLGQCRALEDSGAAALVMYSLFEEAILPEVMNRKPGQAGNMNLGTTASFTGELEKYLDQVSSLKKALEIPIIASLNSVTEGGWLRHAKEIEDAGADALELNVYYVAANGDESGADVEHRYLEIIRAVKQSVSIPVTVKLSPYFSAVAHLIRQVEGVGADGVVLFNRFYQPDIDIATLRLIPSLHPSTSTESLLAMRWIAVLHGRTRLSIGATGGVHTPEDCVKLLLVGADVVHLCTALLQKGPEHMRVVLNGLEDWMRRQEFDDIDLMRGRVSQLAVPNPAEFERANYVNVIEKHSHGKVNFD
jgi:dihydroorotate dehydrogenase (fumarate)